MIMHIHDNKMRKRIVILPGDGIGTEVTAEGRKVLERIAETFGHTFEFENALIGHATLS